MRARSAHAGITQIRFVGFFLSRSDRTGVAPLTDKSNLCDSGRECKVKQFHIKLDAKFLFAKEGCGSMIIPGER